MKKAIASIHYAISKSEYSHRGSWPRIWGKLTHSTIIGAKDDWKDYDMILLYHGMEWSGALNMFGGAKDPSSFQKFLDAKNGSFVGRKKVSNRPILEVVSEGSYLVVLDDSGRLFYLSVS